MVRRHMILTWVLAFCVGSAAGACGGEELCAVGNCGMAGLVHDPQLETQALGTLGPLALCVSEASTFCDGTEGIRCLDSEDHDYNAWTLIISSAEGWQRLASQWPETDGCELPTPPTSWSDASLVVAAIRARNACKTHASHQVMADAHGQPHVEVTLDFDHDGSDCIVEATTGVVLGSGSDPTVCMRVSSY